VRVDEKSPSGVALILLDAGGENLISVAPGANWRVRRLDVRAAAPVFARCSVAVLQLEVPPAAVAEGIRQARRAGCLVILNPAPAPARPLPASLLRTVDILTPNRSEASALTGIRVDSVRSAERAARHLLRQGAGTVIVTLGPQGALAVTPDDSFHAPPLPVRVVDTVGAGDAFNGALACALAEKRDLKDAVSFASAAAGLAVTRPGAQPSMPHRKEILDALRTFR
jgi:ribokinase